MSGTTAGRPYGRSVEPPALPYPEGFDDPRPPRARAGDGVATLALFCAYAYLLAALLFYSAFWLLGLDACGVVSGECPISDLLPVFYLVHDGLGSAVFVVLLVVAVVRRRRGRSAFWLPLVGIAVQATLLWWVLESVSRVS